MKAFVVVAFLVASVASQRLDIVSQLNRERSLFKADRPVSFVEDLLLKEKLGEHFLNTEQEYPTWGRQQVTILSLEELMSTSLFRTYYNIPLFRQFWEEHPIIFQKYVQSVLFQQFWTYPEFQTYFQNPYLFYKYIVPQVQVIAQSVNRHHYVDFFNTNKFYPYGIQHHQGYGIEGLRYPTINSRVNHRFLLDRIYKNLMMNYGKVEGIETLTDVKVLPTGQIKEQTFGKIVDPITGEEKITVGDYKVVDEKMVPVQTLNFPMNRFVESEMMKNALLKRMYLNKIFNRRHLTPEYETVFGKKFVPEYETVFGKKFVPEYETVFGKKFVPEYETVFGKRFVPEYETVFDRKHLTPEYETIMGEHVTPVVYEPEMTRYGSVVPRDIYTHKWMSPYVARIYGINKVNNFLPYGHHYGQQYNKMDLINKFNTQIQY